MKQIGISKEQAKQFAYDCFDVIIRDIKEQEEKRNKNHYAPPSIDLQKEVVNM